MRNILTANAILKDKTIVALIAQILENNIILNISILEKGFYIATKSYKKILEKNPLTVGSEYIKHLMDSEVYDIANGKTYNITYNFD